MRIQQTSSGYEPKRQPQLPEMDLLMGSRRKATKEELEQGEKEMKAAQERMTEEMESSGVL